MDITGFIKYMNNVGDIITEFLVRNNRTTTDSFITDTMLKNWVRNAHTWACAQKKWPFTEGRTSTTYASTEEWYFEGYKADAIKVIVVGSDRFQKVNFRDYLEMKETTPNDTKKVFSDYGRALFINSASGASGTMTVYGQYQPVIDPTDLTAETIFSSWNAEANEAIVEKMTSYLKRREHLPDEALQHDQLAIAKIEEVATGIAKEQSNYQTRSGDGMFKRMDVLEGGFRDDLFNRDQWN